jgi:hypothetical protein
MIALITALGLFTSYGLDKRTLSRSRDKLSRLGVKLCQHLAAAANNNARAIPTYRARYRSLRENINFMIDLNNKLASR